MIEIVDAGFLTTVQDLGRPGYAHIGVPRSGAVDPGLAARCNRLVGNLPGAALFETIGAVTVRAVTAITVASDDEPVARTVSAGETIQIGAGGRQWHYLAVRGGVVVDAVLGSRSTDTLSGLGPPPVARGDRFAVGPEPTAAPLGEVVPVRSPDPVARIHPGPRLDWFAAPTFDQLLSTVWEVGAASRVGVRLSGAPLVRTRLDELPSEGLVRGAIQVPPDGDPIMMLSDHPTTGGYPVVAIVDPADVSIVAQGLAGSPIRFRSR